MEFAPGNARRSSRQGGGKPRSASSSREAVAKQDARSGDAKFERATTGQEPEYEKIEDGRRKVAGAVLCCAAGSRGKKELSSCTP